MDDRPSPSAGQLIGAAVLSALLCLPIYALIAALSMVLFGSGFGRSSLLDILLGIAIVVPMSFFGIMIWPISLVVAVSLFALSGKLLSDGRGKRAASRWIWAIAGALVGLLTGMAMAIENVWRNSGVLHAGLGFATVPFAIPTGILGMLVCRRFLKFLAERPGRYAAPGY